MPNQNTPQGKGEKDSMPATLSTNKLKHTLGVASFLYEAAKRKGYSETKVKEMFILGFLHDIGYAFDVNPEGHSKRGGLALKESGYKHWLEVYHHGAASPPYHSEELDLLNMADLSVEFNGERVAPEERIKSINERYGSGSYQYKNAQKLYDTLFGSVEGGRV
jgi:hypothetical protein